MGEANKMERYFEMLAQALNIPSTAMLTWWVPGLESLIPQLKGPTNNNKRSDQMGRQVATERPGDLATY